MKTHLGVLDARQFLGREDFVIWDCRTEGYGVFDGQLHFHDFYELSFFYDGQGRYTLNGSEMPITKGLLTVTTPSDYHAVSVERGQFLAYYNIIFREGLLPDSVTAELYALKKPLCLMFSGKEYDAFASDILRIFRDYTAEPKEITPPLTAELVKCEIVSLIVRLIKHALPAEESNERNEDAVIRSALLYIREHYRSHITLSEVAEAVGRSPGYFSGFFQKKMQLSFSQYLLRYRLVTAASFVANRGYSMKEVAYLCGFRSLPYFSSAFKNYFGMSPHEYRKRNT